MMTRRLKVTIAGEEFIATVNIGPMESTQYRSSTDIEMIFKPEDTERLRAAQMRWDSERTGITFGNIGEGKK